ncbi:polysaccharide deacetylase family protein [Oleiagrimonas sp. MCCC 1A03011]|uniref:DUF2334 domain-containing protein n=1 Tax=Oleiagrimonas sp. MCCC 1A03011 TaxID=1926883 RepID=UPI00143D5479|nr:polysaccharide deacetylase family protein [Oleiagrimonas sp. MCCC 1A03011]
MHTVWLTALALFLATPALAGPAPHDSHGKPSIQLPLAPGGSIADRTLPAPPAPSSATLPTSRPSLDSASRLQMPTPQTFAALLSPSVLPAAVPTLFAAAPGADAERNTLILYDSTGAWAWLGEAYAVQTGNLVSHASRYTMHPAIDYVAGEMDGYTGMIYIGSTYDEPLPTALLDDVLATDKPVLWMNSNIWQLSQRAGDFGTRFGWMPLFYNFDEALTVTYKGVDLTRSALAVPSGLLQTSILDPTMAEAVATITDSNGVTSPWATRSGHFTYIGEIPFSYVGSDDRYLAAVDLIGQVADPNMPDRNRALVRIEDVGPDASPNRLRRIADYLYSRGVPFSVAVYTHYLDPNGVYNDGVPVSQPMSARQSRRVRAALQYMVERGGTLLMHGYTHQYQDIPNPYSGVSADDFEFYRSHISADDYVIYDAPPAEDSAAWTQLRIDAAFAEFAASGLPTPTIFEFPHYAGSAIDYQVVQQNFGVRYDRALYAAGWCPNGACGSGTPDYTRIYGQFFPYTVRDIFGSIVLPESLGNVEPVEVNHHPPRSVQDILASAQRNTVIKDNVQSFFFHPYLPLNQLKKLVQGIQGMGYEFVSPETLKDG